MTLTTLANTTETTGLRILVVVIIVLIIKVVLDTFLQKVYKNLLRGTPGKKGRAKKRVDTLVRVENSLLFSAGAVYIVFLILSNFIDITPLLASAGLVGLALSLGAQSLVKDFFTGFFYLTQDQFGVGDMVQLGAANGNLIGTISAMTLRTITIQDLSGNVTTFPNSSVIQITNLTKDWSLFDITYPFPSAIEVDDMYRMMNEAGEKIVADHDLSKYLLDKPTLIGIESMTNDVTNVRFTIKTVSAKQFEVGRKYRYELKKLLEAYNKKKEAEAPKS
jgi:small-conductance mechanosensitive channel